MSNRQRLRCGVTAAAVLLVGWAIWQCQRSARLVDIDIDITRWCSFSEDPDAAHDAEREESETSDLGWPLPHTHEESISRPSNPTAVRYERTALFPGVLVDAAAWCLMLFGTGCVVWRWAANARQFRLGTLFSLFVVAAILLGWWKHEHDDRAVLVFGKLVTITFDPPPMLALLLFPWYVYVPVLFGLGCGIYGIGWMGGRILAKMIKGVHHVALPKLRRTDR